MKKLLKTYFKNLLKKIGEKIPFRVQLVEDWKQLWKAASVQYSSVGLVVFGLLSAAQETWIRLPKDLVEGVPGASWIGTALFAAVLVGRFTMLVRKGGGKGGASDGA